MNILLITVKIKNHDFMRTSQRSLINPDILHSLITTFMEFEWKLTNVIPFKNFVSSYYMQLIANRAVLEQLPLPFITEFN